MQKYKTKMLGKEVANHRYLFIATKDTEKAVD